MRHVKFTLILLLISGMFSLAKAQSVLDPTDPVVNYDSTNPPVQPPWGEIGKWVRTPRFTWWNTSSYKAYIYKGIQFRIKFPKTYNPNAADGKKYPAIVFWHGLLEAGDIHENEFQMYWGGDFYRHATDNGVFDGYTIFMQAPLAGGSFFSAGHYQAMKEILDYMTANNKLDPFRVTSNGLSSGGLASWQMFLDHPTYISNIIAMSAPGNWNIPDVIEKTKFTPFWYANGGLDDNPTPFTADQNVAAFTAAGMNFVRYFYPNANHNTWEPTWGEPKFWPTVNNAYASNPGVLFGKTKFNSGETVSATIGLAPGFDQYEWRKDGTLIPGATTRSIQVSSFGVYDARVRRGTIWSEWSRIPVHIRLNNLTTKIQAESYSAMSNIGTETTVDVGGGQNVGWQDDNDWMDYNVNIPTAGTYTLNFRVATFFNNPRFQVRKSDGTILANVYVPHTGDWQRWVTISTIVALPAGPQTLRIMTINSMGGWNFNWWEIDGSSLGPPPPPPPPANVPPTVNAGTDQNISLPTNSVSLAGTAADSDGTINTIAWTKVSGPAGGTIVSPSQLSTQVNNLAQGVYVFRLSVTDNGGSSSTDDISVTVNPPLSSGGTLKIEAENYIAMSGIGTEPTQDAGGGMNVGWQDNNDWMDYSINLANAGTYNFNFRVASYFSGAQFQLRNSAGTVLTTVVVPNTGSFQSWTTVTRQVTLPAGAQTIRVFTNAANGGWNFNWMELSAGSATPNNPPTANAGADQTITLPTNFVALSGSGSDPGGSIVSYTWSKASGPSGGNIAAPSSPSTNVTGLNAGTYVFTLTVIDNLGAQGTDNITITVNPGVPTNTTLKIEAEDYITMSGIGTETTADAGGGLNVGWQDNNDWMNYNVNLANGGTRTVTFRVASFFTGAQFQLRNNAGTVLTTLTVPNTGSFQNWTTIQSTVNLPAGPQTLRLYTTNANGGWNINWWTIGATSGARGGDAGVIDPVVTDALSLEAYPNPVGDRMNLVITNRNKGNFQVQIVNSAGVAVKRMTLNKPSAEALSIYMNTSELRTGIYLLQVTNGSWRQTLKLVKE